MTPIAILALYTFPLVAIWLFRKHPPTRATTYAFLIAFFFLPAATWISPPMFPTISKENIAGLCVFVIYTLRNPGWLMREKVGRGPELLAILSVFIGFIATWRTNPEPLAYGRLAGLVPFAQVAYLPGQSFKDCGAWILTDLVSVVLPFVIGRVMFKTREDARLLCYLISLFGLIYVPLMLIESWMSPQIHVWVYGFYPHSFAQAARWGGWRPQVFMIHGLTLAKAMVIVFLAIAAARAARIPKIGWLDIRTTSLFSPLIVVLGKSMGPLIYMLVFWLLFSVLKARRLQLLLIAVLCGVVLAYFYVQTNGLLDLDAIGAWIAQYSEDRAHSLMYRFRNEGELLERAEQKPWFGWGSYGRAHIWDVDMGHDVTVTDGYWIHRYSWFGVTGLFTPFYLWMLPALVWVFRFRKVKDPGTQTMLNAIVLMPVVYAVDCLPNSIQNNFCFLLAGAAYSLVIHCNPRSPKWTGEYWTGPVPHPGR